MDHLDFFTPVSEEVLENAKVRGGLGSTLIVHSSEKAFPDLEGVKIAILGIPEDRLQEDRSGHGIRFNRLRKSLYGLFPGNWDVQIADLGDIMPGETVEDTFHALESAVRTLVGKGIIPVILGGSQDLVYGQYRGYDGLDQMLNLVNVDARFDLGDADRPLSNRSYVGKIVVTKPYNLFNYSNIGYQTYFNSQDEIELMDRLFFDAFRLGDISADIHMVEPIMRDADLVAIDLSSISCETLGNPDFASPNGFNGKEICALARYAGISDKVSSFGIYEYRTDFDNPVTNMLVAQVLWYFIEGVNFRKDENTNSARKEFIKYQVPVEEEILVFYKSPLSGRWWIEIPFISPGNNKLKRHTLLPCTEADYLQACNQVIPERWFRTKRKNEI